MTLDGLICTYARTTTSVQVYLRWPPGRSVRSRAASTRRRRPLRHENDCWLRLLAHVWMGFASFFVSALTRSWATGLKFYGLQRYSLKISFGQGGARSPVSPPKRSASGHDGVEAIKLLHQIFHGRRHLGFKLGGLAWSQSEATPTSPVPIRSPSLYLSGVREVGRRRRRNG